MSIAKLRKVKGFTLIELMIVVAIIGILAAVAIPKFADLVTKSKEAGVKGNIGSLRSAVSIYYGDNEGLNPTVGSLYTSLTTGAKYMPVTGFGDFTLPKNTQSSHPGHAYGRVTAEGNINQSVTWAEGAATVPLFYNTTTGDLAIQCSHGDTKGVVWSTY